MRDPARIDKILDELKKLWLKNEDMRLGQLLENYVFFRGQRGDKTSCALFYQEDSDTLEIIRKTLNKGIQNPLFENKVWKPDAEQVKSIGETLKAIEKRKKEPPTQYKDDDSTTREIREKYFG